MRLNTRSLSFVILLLLSLAAPQAQSPAAPKVTTPEQFFGHKIGADYVLPNYTKFTDYVRKLDAESDRMTVQSIGKTAEGRDQLMAIITAPENFKKLARYQEISRRLSQAEGLTDDTARAQPAYDQAPWGLEPDHVTPAEPIPTQGHLFG